MTDRSARAHSHDIEAALEALFSAPAPDATFVADLEQRLQASCTTARPTPERSLLARLWATLAPAYTRHRRATVTLALLLALAVTLMAIGPQRVWADLQRLLGYVPGVGFVTLDESRVLARPVEVTRDGVTLRVEQVVVQPNRTTIVIRSDGLPPEEPRQPGAAGDEEDFRPRLRLPDGRTLEATTVTLRRGAGTLDFPALPDEIYRATLDLPRLPLVPAGAAPEPWRVPLVFRPATGELVAELFPQPYAPADASATQAGITVRVLEVAHSPDETVLRAQAQWSDPTWETHFLNMGDRSPELRDDLGHVYGNTVPSSSGSFVRTTIERRPAEPEATPTLPSAEQALAFAPVSPAAQRLTLVLHSLQFDVPAEGEFTVDLGKNPQVGDHWPLDVTLNVAGFPVRITGMRLMQEELSLRDGSTQRTVLRFDFAPVPDQAERSLRFVHLDSDHVDWSGGSGSWNQAGGLHADLELREGQALPGGLVRVRVTGVSVVVRGPWTITWQVPGAGASGAAPVTLRPVSATDTHNDLTLGLRKVTLTDRLTAITLALVGQADGVTLYRTWVEHPAIGHARPFLEDDRGRRYEPAGWGVRWQPPGAPEPEPGSLNFPAVQPLARRLTLHLPAVEVALPGAAGFDVMVPDGVRVQSRAGGPPASDPWPVDIPVEVAGYRLRLTQARLEEVNGTIVLALASDPLDERRGSRWLTGLRLAVVTAPDGRRVPLETAFSAAGTRSLVDPTRRVRLGFDVVDHQSGALRSGRYHVEIDGALVTVKGPWRLSWVVQVP